MKTTKIVLSLVLPLIAFTVLWCADASADWTIRVVSPENLARIALSGSTTFTVEVQQNGSPSSGQTVTFSTKPSAGPGITTPTLSSASGSTGANGQASTTVTFPLGISGGYRLIATSQGVSAKVDVLVGFTPREPQPPPPTTTWTIGVVSSLSTVAPGGSVTLTATVRQNGSRASGESVEFSASPSTGVTFNPSSGTTDGNGQASTTVTFANAGSYTLTATSQGVSDRVTVTVRTTRPPRPPTTTTTTTPTTPTTTTTTTPTTPTTPTTITPPVATTLSKISGDGQQGLIGQPLAKPFVVEVQDQNGNPLQGTTVTFAVTAGSGTLSATTPTTDANGQAQTTLTLGAMPGTNSVQASVEGIEQTQVFSAEASLPVATTLSKISGDGQQGSVGQPLANPFVVEVQDQNGNPLAGVTVAFAVTAGSGTLSATTPTTDANGQAQTTLTLGSMLGTNSVQASVEGIEQTQVFSAEASLLESVRKIVVDVTGSDPRAVQLYQFELELQQGWNLIHLPLVVYAVNNELHRIQTAADLYELIHPIFMFIHSSSEEGFIGVHEESDIALGPNQGIAVLTDAPATFTLVGTRLPEPFQFERGLNLIGMPRQSVALQQVSDWLRIYEEAVVVVTTVDGEFSLVERAGDPGDHEITGGQSFLILMTAPRKTFFYGPAWGTRIE